MILPDTSVWVDFLRSGDRDMKELLDSGNALMHPYVLGEIALGHLSPRASILAQLSAVPMADEASLDEFLRFIEFHNLVGAGIGFVDVHLLASALLIPGLAIWTRDRRLAIVADRMGLGASPPFD